MIRFVVDASVAVKWVVTEIHSQSARRLLGRNYTLLVPDFFFAEVTNVFWKRVLRKEDDADNAKVALEAMPKAVRSATIASQPLQVCPSLSLMFSAFDTAVQTKRAVYDCVYLTLAVESQCQMVTADEKLVNALQQDPLAASLCWVEDLP